MDIDTAADTHTPVQPTDVDRDEERRKRSGAILLAVVVALIVLWWILTQTTVVPNLTGLSEAQARRALREASLMTGNVSEVRSRQQRPGRVADQGPYGGVRVMKGSEIDFALAVRVGLALQDGGAEATSPAYGYSLTEDEIDSGSTLSDPADQRTLYSAQGVPMVQALTESDAIATLRAAGYRTRVRHGPVTTGPGRGKVYYQDPAPEEMEPAGTVVEIWISTGGPGAGNFPYSKPVPDR